MGEDVEEGEQPAEHEKEVGVQPVPLLLFDWNSVVWLRSRHFVSFHWQSQGCVRTSAHTYNVQRLDVEEKNCAGLQLLNALLNHAITYVRCVILGYSSQYLPVMTQNDQDSWRAMHFVSVRRVKCCTHLILFFFIQQPKNVMIYINSSGYVTDLLVSKHISASKQKIVLLHQLRPSDQHSLKLLNFFCLYSMFAVCYRCQMIQHHPTE